MMPRDSLRLRLRLVGSEEVCRYKYDAFLSHRFARDVPPVVTWLNGI